MWPNRKRIGPKRPAIWRNVRRNLFPEMVVSHSADMVLCALYCTWLLWNIHKCIVFFKKHRAFALEICRIKQQRKKTPTVPTILPDRDPKQSRDQQQEKERSVHGHLEKSYL
jgi:hypothetical protein